MIEPTTTDRPVNRDRRRRRRSRFAAGLVAVALAIGIAAAPALAADPTRTTTVPVRTLTDPAGSTSTTVTWSVDLSRDSANVLQYTSYWCVPAATQTMINIVTGASDRSRATQQRLYYEIQKANRYDYATNGNDVRGWSRVLTARLGVSRAYSDQSFTSRSAAYAAIVDAMYRTRRPVGIVVDAGRHAWTVVGFTVRETVGQPGSREILGLTVVGPLGSPKDPWPKRYYTVSQLATRYTRYHEWQRAVIWEGKYVIVAPVWTNGSVTVSR